MSLVAKKVLAAALIAATALTPTMASAETLFGALTKAYQLNATLNYNRAGVRVTDENVPLAKSGYRPTVGASGTIDYTDTEGGTRLTTGSFGVQINQMLFDGFQTKNNVRTAEAQVRASQESLRNQEQNTLFDAASAYMDVIRDRQIAVLTEQNLQFLTEQARAARSRFEVGEGTRTDVAQADASRLLAIAQLSAARAQAQVSEATYQQVIGDAPGKLQPGQALSKMLPKSVDSAVAMAAIEHPAIIATQHLVDASAFAVKSAEGAALPGVTANAGVARSYRNTEFDGLPGVGGASDGSFNSASIGATLTIPIYTGGAVSARVRQSKETLGQARIQVDVTRDQVRQAVVSAWSQYVAARENVSANREQVAAQQLALDGVIEERNVGQRTTLDVLDAQADVISAQIDLVGSQRDVVVASYAIVSAMGALTAERLGLQVAIHRPQEHYDAVKNKAAGFKTPDGR
ncbi:TolC family outer membrane protein [Mesorhizobium sp. VNQ89]|uniref:TolC family outer membrane protein n=1 Tax=Mesorhizobium quangtriensis TaxID=3157709 RepID=UPI0032B79EAC